MQTMLKVVALQNAVLFMYCPVVFGSFVCCPSLERLQGVHISLGKSRLTRFPFNGHTSREQISVPGGPTISCHQISHHGGKILGDFGSSSSVHHSVQIWPNCLFALLLSLASTSSGPSSACNLRITPLRYLDRCWLGQVCFKDVGLMLGA